MTTPPNSPSESRPKRFEMELPIEFRPHDSNHWWQAKTEDISANGILFRTRERVPPRTPVDVKLQLPASLTGERAVRLLCSGFIVRSVEPQLPSGETRIAATFVTYKLANGEPGPIALPETRRDVANVVHRLNGLLFIIQGKAELLSLNPSEEPGIRSVALQIQQAAKDTATLVRFLAKMLP
jgi:hypothetical protein